jgi:hypothetical protein
MKKKSTEDPSWGEIGKAIGTKIEEECKEGECRPWQKKDRPPAPGCVGTGGAIYGLGFLGALVYYITTAPSLLDAIIGILKALLWPAFLVYELMKFLGM